MLIRHCLSAIDHFQLTASFSLLHWKFGTLQALWAGKVCLRLKIQG